MNMTVNNLESTGTRALRLPVKSLADAFLLGSAIFGSQLACAAGLSPPTFEAMDRHGVNVATGKPTPSLTDVSIGGDLGLSHTISSYTGNFVNAAADEGGIWGFHDKYSGTLRWTLQHVYPFGNSSDASQWVYVLRASDGGGSFDFTNNGDGTFTAYNGDIRNTLTFAVGTGFTWIKADGTAVNFGQGMSSLPSMTWQNSGQYVFGMYQIIRPNGLTVTISGGSQGDDISSVVTNTGYQLRYVYVQNTNNTVPNDVPSNPFPGPANASGWSSQTPRYVVGINNAVDYCSSTLGFNTSVADACPSLTRTWPTATYSWPNGMPRYMYFNPGSFTVTDSLGGVTTYYHTPYKMPAALNDPYTIKVRLTGITAATGETISYNYTTDITATGVEYQMPILGMWGAAAHLTNSQIGTDILGYSNAVPYTGSAPAAAGSCLTLWNSNGIRGIPQILSHCLTGIYNVTTWDKVVNLEQTLSNRVIDVTDLATNVKTVPTYDPSVRGNVTAIKKNGLTFQTAGYPATCTNRKTCNQATWIKDANGNETDYTYEPNSGQVASIMMPPDNHGIRPVKLYTYTPLYAYYKNSSGAYQQAASPVYMLTHESTCLTSATNLQDGSCSAGASDQVTTDYDYGAPAGPNNLNLLGVAVTAYVNGAPQVHRTCYSYDPYGNRIGETTPLAGVASCH